MRKILIILLAFPHFTLAQNEKKIDSVFQHYFKVIEIELGEDDLIKYPNLIEEIKIDNRGNSYVNRYYNESINFLEKISGITAIKKEKGQTITSIVDIALLTKWKEWYRENMYRISWSKSKSKPKISFWKGLFRKSLKKSSNPRSAKSPDLAAHKK